MEKITIEHSYQVIIVYIKFLIVKKQKNKSELHCELLWKIKEPR